MRDELNTYEQIDRYLNKQLSGEELSAFERNVEADASLLEEVNNHRLIHELVIDQGLLDVKNKLKALDTKGGSSKINWKLFTGIIVVSLVATLGFLAIRNNPERNLPAVKPKQLKALQNKPTAINATVNEMPPGAKKSSPASEKKPDHETNVAETHTSLPPQKSGESLAPVDAPLQKNSAIVSEKVIPDERPDPVNKKANEPEPCNLNNSMLQVTAIESCMDSPTGQIIIDKGSAISGKAPFMFSLDAENYRMDYVFTDLHAGVYALTVKDARGCIWLDGTQIRIKEKDCRPYEYAFDPDKQEIWKFPLENNTNGKIEIYNRNGSLVYSAQILNNYPDSWTGMTTDQEPLPMGSYSFILRSKERVLYGNVTLLK